MFETDATRVSLEEDFLSLLGETPLDDVIDALEGAFRRRAGEITDSDAADFYRNTAAELHELKNRDFILSQEANATIQ
jgi:hypothetical protein